MKLRCREGDLALIIRDEPGCEVNIGRVVTVHGPLHDTEERGPTWLIVPVQAGLWAVGAYGKQSVWHGHITLESQIEHPDDWLLPLRPEHESEGTDEETEKPVPVETEAADTVSHESAACLGTAIPDPGLADRDHPRIHQLRKQVAALPASPEYRSALLRSIGLQGRRIASRPVYTPEEGLDDLEALQQLTLGDMLEHSARNLFVNAIQKGEKTMSDPLALVVKAAHFAADKHRNQRRKDAHATPYINHPLSLAHILTEEGGVIDPVVICAALLHDTIEDTQTSHGELASAFGKEIADVVDEVTDDKTLDKQARKDAQIAHAPHLSQRAKLVKLADKIANCRDVALNPPHDWSNARRIKYFEWASAVVEAMGDVHPGLQAAFREVAEKGFASA